MKSKDFYSSLFWMAIGVYVCYGGYDLELGTLYDPGSGFIFFWVGLIMIGLSLAILVKAVREKAPGEEVGSLWVNVRWKKIVAILTVLFLYAYFFNLLGFILSTFLLLIFLFKAGVQEPQRWLAAILGAILSSATAYVVFQLWLGSQLPAGFLGIG